MLKVLLFIEPLNLTRKERLIGTKYIFLTQIYFCKPEIFKMNV